MSMGKQPHNNEEEFSDDEVIVPERDADFVPEEEGLVRAERKSVRMKEELDTCRDQKQEYLDGWQRARADLQNIKKQFESDRRESILFAEQRLLTELLPVLDSFEMAFSNQEAWSRVDATWSKGVEHIHGQLLGVLQAHGVTQYNPLGEIFNPAEHDPVLTEAASSKEEDHRIVKVLQRGYRLNGRLIRPAKVAIAEWNDS